ncbi:M20 family metallopeptidase [Arthrobacter monumenti]
MPDIDQAINHSNPVNSAIASTIADKADQVLELSRRIHSNPEISFEETASAAALCQLFEDEGFDMARGYGSLPTAFTAVAGTGQFTVGICVEYDALPGIGHGCGHNVIAGASVAAALGLKPLVDQLDIRLKVIGTPAEEHGGGKAVLISEGAFDDVDIAMMMHPTNETPTYNITGSTCQAVGRFRATYTGRGAHAAASPSAGINAADAATITQVAIGLLRQQLPDTNRVALFVREAGRVTNIIPDKAVVEFECRATTLAAYEELLAKVRRCFEAGALATGTQLEIEATEPLYEPLIQDDLLAALWNESISFLGHSVEGRLPLLPASTDMGNVSQKVPSIHPFVGIPGVGHALHTKDFAAAADTPAAYDLMFDSAIAMAWIAATIATSPDHIETVRSNAAALNEM